MKISEILADHESVGVEPGAVADPVAGMGRIIVVGRISLHAQVGSPHFVSVPHGSRQGLTDLVCSNQAAQVPSLAFSAGNKEAHARRRSARRADDAVPFSGCDNHEHPHGEQRDVKPHIASLLPSGRSFSIETEINLCAYLYDVRRKVFSPYK